MKKFYLTLAMIALAASLCACQEGAYNDLECDAATYQNECLDESHYMTCYENRLIVIECAKNQICLNENATEENSNLCK